MNISRHWVHAALEPQLWTFIVISPVLELGPYDSIENYVRNRARRSSKRKLHVRIDGDMISTAQHPNALDALVGEAGAIASRWETVAIRHLHGGLIPYLLYPMPSLVHLEIKYPSVDVNLDTAFPFVPSLTSLCLIRMGGILLQSNLASQVLDFHLDAFDGRDFIGQLPSCPNIRSLFLRMDDYSQSLFFANPSVNLPYLREIVLPDASDIYLLDYLQVPSLTHLKMHHSWRDRSGMHGAISNMTLRHPVPSLQRLELVGFTYGSIVTLIHTLFRQLRELKQIAVRDGSWNSRDIKGLFECLEEVTVCPNLQMCSIASKDGKTHRAKWNR